MTSAVFAMVWLMSATNAPASPDASPSLLFKDAVGAQLEKRQDEAQQIYERIASGGLRNADVEYNLGTSYADTKQWGPAVLHLRRAEFLRSASDVSANLSKVREKVLEQAPNQAREVPLFYDIADAAVRWPTDALAAAAFVIVSMLGLWASFGKSMLPRWFGSVVGTTLFVALVTASLSVLRMVYFERRAPAVVVTKLLAREGPDERFKSVVELAPGSEVRLGADEPAAGFWLVHLPGGGQGYVPETAIARVVDWQ